MAEDDLKGLLVRKESELTQLRLLHAELARQLADAKQRASLAEAELQARQQKVDRPLPKSFLARLIGKSA